MNAFFSRTAMISALGLLCAAIGTAIPPVTPPLIFPEPHEIQVRSDRFSLEKPAPVLVPQDASAEDLHLARFLVAELSERHGVALAIERTSAVPASGSFILIGSAGNPLVRQYLEHRGSQAGPKEPEGYTLDVDENAVVVAGTDDAGAFYGLQSLRQLIQGQGPHTSIQGVQVRDWPSKPYRGIKLYLPGRENIGYFKRFVRDFMALYKFNRVVVEMNGAMRLDSHPEVNAGWLELGRNLNATRRDRSWGPRGEFQDSANADAADSGILEKSEVADLVRYARENYVEFIPEVPSLTHSYYLLARHRELAEIPNAEWPDTYCPLASGVYRLLFDVLDEYIDVTQPKTVHIGHDEWRIPFGVCPRCKGHDPRELYAQDVNKIYEHLREKNIKVSIYGDHLIEALRGERVQKTSYQGVPTYETPGGLSAEQASTLIPKDILVFNWFWNERIKGGGEVDDIALSDWGFEQVYNNCEPGITNYEQRAAHKGVIGAAPSSWAATNEFTFGKDLMYNFLGCEDLVWTGLQPPQDRLSETIQNLLPGLRRNLSPTPFPSDSDPVVPIRIEASLNTASIPGLGLDAMKNGRVAAGKKVFDLQSQAGKRVIAVPEGGSESPAIRIGQDVSSILFLHALAKPAHNMTADAGTWNYADTADLPGWYEAVYADGFVQTIPLRYGVNILETGWGKSHVPNNLAYEAELVDCGEANRDRVTFFAYEWVNPRRGIAVKEIRLKTASGFRNVLGKPTPQNTIMLAGVSVVKKEIPPGPKRPEFAD